MSQKISCLQAYKAMNRCLDTFYFQTYDDCLSDVLSWGALYSNKENQEPQTIDPAVWHDWMKGVKIIMHDDLITFNSAEFTLEQAYACAHQYLIIFCDMGADQSVEFLRDLFGAPINQSVFTQLLWNRWKDSVDIVVQETPFGEIGHFLGETTSLNERESFNIMKFFLNDICTYNKNIDLIKLVQNSRLKNTNDFWTPIQNIIDQNILDIWRQAIINAMQLYKSETLNILVAYQAMPIFLKTYFKNNNSKLINNLIQEFSLNENNKPINIGLWRNWSSRASDTNRKQKEMIYNVVSIKRPISQTIAFEIIKKWFYTFEILIGIETIEKIIFNRSLWQQEVNTIKTKPRSYLLLDDELTVLEAYHIMLNLLEINGKNIDDFAIDSHQQKKPKNFVILLQWLNICDNIIKYSNNK